MTTEITLKQTAGFLVKDLNCLELKVVCYGFDGKT